MAELIHRHSTHVRTPDGEIFTANISGERQQDGLWAGWIEFHDRDGRVVLRTDRETSQMTREALDYWASGLEPTYIEGAFARAHIVRAPGTVA
jgi:hypothetical protein